MLDGLVVLDPNSTAQNNQQQDYLPDYFSAVEAVSWQDATI